MLTGFLRPTEGSANVLGRDVWRDGVAARADLGFLPDYPGMDEHLTGNEVLDLLWHLQQRPTPQRKPLLDRL